MLEQVGYQINIEIYCTQIKNIKLGQKYSLTVYTKDGDGVFQEYKIIESQSNEDFVCFKSFQLKYLFEVAQPLRFDLYQSQFIGSCQATLGEIIRDKQRIYYLTDLLNEKNGLLSFKLERSKENVQKIKIDIYIRLNQSIMQSLLGLFKQEQYISLCFYKKSPYKQPILETTSKLKQIELHWSNIETTFELLCDNDPLQSIFCEILQQDGYQQTIFGEFEFWKYQIDKQYYTFDIKYQNEITGRAVIKKFDFDIEGQFYQYIQNGVQLALIIAIDFTDSNGDPNLEHSLHSISKESQYLQAIEQVANILLDYDSDKKVPMYGFGGIPHFLNQNNNKHCFSLGEANSIQDIRNIYKKAIQTIKFDGPTCFNPIIKQTIKWAQEEKDKKENQYFVLLILTDGKYMDEDQTIISIVEASRLPLSLIIVGIGDSADLQAMNKLDGNNGLIDINGKAAERDIVKYVNYNQVKGDKTKLAAQLLDELPTQLVNYMKFL